MAQLDTAQWHNMSLLLKVTFNNKIFERGAKFNNEMLY